jgi:pimeloyl-ACP methyl ester carboxylesterase
MPHPSPTESKAHSEKASDLRGASRLTIDAVAGVTSVVEAMHRNIASRPAILGKAPDGPTGGITGVVYRCVRGVTRAVGMGLDVALAQLAPLLGTRSSSPRRDALLAALNGVLGDYLAASENSLAITMHLRKDGRPLMLNRAALAAAFARPSAKLVVLAHGLCMSDRQWYRQGHDHGASLARDLGHTPIYLHYNSGRHVSSTGREFADLMEQLLQEWPMPVEELVIIGHSMGGLVSRSACHYARLAGHSWVQRLDKLIFLGTPHHGAPLERIGNWFDILVGLSPYTAPLARLGKIRSAGIKDLRHGNVLDEDWAGHASDHPHDARVPVPLPKGVRCYAIAASKQAQPAAHGTRLRSDGWVPVASALGHHKNPALSLPFPESRRWVGYGMNHLDLLSDPDVYERIKCWVAGDRMGRDMPSPAAARQDPSAKRSAEASRRQCGS